MSGAKELSPYEDWNGKLAPTNRRTADRRTIDRRTIGQQQPEEIFVPEKQERVDIFQGVSAKARTTVFQFIWELKLRVFSEGEILEQELRKDPEDRV
jgi:hypothetical protein